MALPYNDDDIDALLARDQQLRDMVLGRLRQSQSPAGATPDVAERQMTGAWVNGQWVPLPPDDLTTINPATPATAPAAADDPLATMGQAPQDPTPASTSLLDAAKQIGQAGQRALDPQTYAEPIRAGLRQVRDTGAALINQIPEPVRNYISEQFTPSPDVQAVGKILHEGLEQQTPLTENRAVNAVQYARRAVPSLLIDQATESTTPGGALLNYGADLLPVGAMAGPVRRLGKTAQRVGETVAETLPAGTPGAVQSVFDRLPSAVQPKLVRAIVAHPEIKSAVPWLHPQEVAELAHMTPDAQAHVARVLRELPSKEFFGAVARAGQAKKGWYQFSRNAIDHIFGNDAGLFAGILASTSPQTSVESNLFNALNIYKNWVAAGRPTDRDVILQIMGRSVQGKGTASSVLDAWINNTVSVLQGAQSISGPKVDSFWTNLRSRARQTPHGPMTSEQAVTLDAWMGNILSMSSQQFAGSGTKATMARGAPGYSTGYLATTARVREAAAAAGMTPEEVQETMWSWGKALYEQADATGVSAVDIIKTNQLSPAAISGTADFTTLFNDPRYQSIIQQMGPGHAARLQTLKPGQFATPHGPITLLDQQWQLDAARRLDELLASRKMTTQAKVGTTDPGLVNVVVGQEAMPGRSTGIAPGLIDATQGVKDRIARQLQEEGEDLLGRSSAMKATGLPTGASTTGVGYWKPRGGPAEFNTLRAATVQAPLVVTPEGLQGLAPDARAALEFAERMRAGTDAQMAAAFHGVVYDQPFKDSLHVATPRKLTGDNFKQLAELFPPNKYAVANTGEYINVLRFDGLQLREDDARRLEKYLAAMDPETKWEVKPATNVAKYFDPAPSGKWKNRPDRPVTNWMTGGFDALPADVQARFDSDEIKSSMARKLAIFQDLKARGEKVDESFLNLLKILSEGGVSALRQAIGDPKQLLPMLVLAGVARGASPASTAPSDEADRRR